MATEYTPRQEDDPADVIHTDVVRAGKRTYFFDVKATRSEDLYVTITESRKRVQGDGSTTFSRHQIYLYKEDFDKLVESLNGVIDFVKQRKESEECKK